MSAINAPTGQREFVLEPAPPRPRRFTNWQTRPPVFTSQRHPQCSIFYPTCDNKTTHLHPMSPPPNGSFILKLTHQLVVGPDIWVPCLLPSGASSFCLISTSKPGVGAVLFGPLHMPPLDHLAASNPSSARTSMAPGWTATCPDNSHHHLGPVAPPIILVH